MIQEMLNNSSKLIFVAFSFIILLEFLMAIVFFNATKQFIADSRIVDAKITKLEIDRNGQIAHLLMRDPFGSVMSTSLKVPANKFKVDEVVKVLSLKEHPAKVRINSPLSLWLLPGVMLQGSIVMGGALGVMVWLGIAQIPF